MIVTIKLNGVEHGQENEKEIERNQEKPFVEGYSYYSTLE
jgi:hypothetical protein